MGTNTTKLGLLKPSENDFYNQQTEQADNWEKIDDYAVLTNADKNGMWGGEYGGYIQDSVPKELNKRYIDNINGKAFICIKAGDSSVVSNTIEYFTPCNVVDNLGKLQNLDNAKVILETIENSWGICEKYTDGTFMFIGNYQMKREDSLQFPISHFESIEHSKYASVCIQPWYQDPVVVMAYYSNNSKNSINIKNNTSYDALRIQVIFKGRWK